MLRATSRTISSGARTNHKGSATHLTESISSELSSELTDRLLLVSHPPELDYMAGKAQGDIQIGSKPADSGGSEVSTKLSQESNQIGMNGVLGGIARVGVTTAEGVAHTPQGLVDAVVNDYHHPMEIVKAVAGSAAIAVALKTLLPEAGPVGKLAGLAMGGWFLAGSAPGFINSYKTGLNANTWSEMGTAGQQWGDAAGQLGVNSALGYVGYRIGAGVSGNILARESMDGFADAKQNVWDSATDKVKGLLHMDTTIPTASSVGLQPNYSIDGDKATLVDSAQPNPPKNEAILGPVDKNYEMNATVLLRLKASTLKMDRYLLRMSDGKATSLTDENNAYQEKFGVSQEAADAIKAFATKNNLNADTDLRSGRVFVTGKAGDFENAFNVELNRYRGTSSEFIGHTGSTSIPTELAPYVRAVLGVDEQPVATSNLRVMYKVADNGDMLDDLGHVLKPTVSKADPVTPEEIANYLKQGGYLATDIAKAQNFPLSSGGEGQHGAFISLSGGIDLEDYNKFFPDHGLEQPNPLGIIEVGGAKNSPNSPRGGDTENALDGLQMQSVAPKAKIDMILGNNSNQGLNDVVDRALFPQNGEAQKTVLSMSWGLGEQKQSPQVINALSMLFRQGAIRGVQVLAGSGDNGAKSLSDFHQTEFPASDPNVTGVGGLKMILKADGTVAAATTWDEGEFSSTGGGVSKLFKMPWWQKFSNVPNNVDTGKVGRGVPDISTNAAKSTGFPVRVGGSTYVIGGTSAGAPLYAGLLLNINSELAGLGIKPVTPLNPWMYTRANTNIFHDITTGGNHGYEAGKGWDPVSGLGYIDGQEMLKAMKENQTAKVPGASFLPKGLNLPNPQQMVEKSK